MGADEQKRIRELEGALVQLQRRDRTVPDPDVTGEVEAPVESVDLKKAATPVSVVALVIALLGGGAGGIGLLQSNDNDCEDRCRTIVAQTEARVTKAHANAMESHRAEEAARYASQTDVAQLTVKIDMVMETVREIRDDLRGSRRRRAEP